MKKLNLLYIAIFAMLVFVTSCKKDDEESKSDLLVSKNWRPTTFKLNGIDVTEGFLEECNNDDYFDFVKGGTYTGYVGSNLCYDGEENEVGAWTLTNGDKTLTITETGGDPFVLTITTLTSSTLKGTFESDGQTIEVTLTAV